MGKKLSSRILVISSLSDSALQYIPTMNCIFAAQKSVSSFRLVRSLCKKNNSSCILQSVPIDSCVLWQDSGFLQQVSYQMEEIVRI